MWEEVAEGSSRLHNEELHNIYASSNIIRVIKSNRMKWAGNAACMGEMRNMYHILVGSLNGRDHFEDLDMDGKIILECILGTLSGKVQSSSGKGPLVCSCEHGSEPLGSIKGGELLD
jgi:hypothetical protein